MTDNKAGMDLRLGEAVAWRLAEQMDAATVHLRAKSGPRDLPGDDQVVVRRAWLRVLADRLEDEDVQGD